MQRKTSRRRRIVLVTAGLTVLLPAAGLLIRELTAPDLNRWEQQLIGEWFAVSATPSPLNSTTGDSVISWELTRLGTVRQPGKLHLWRGADWRIHDETRFFEFGNMRDTAGQTWAVLKQRLRGEENWMPFGIVVSFGEGCVKLDNIGGAFWLFRSEADAIAFIDAGRPDDFRDVRPIAGDP